MSTAEPSRPLSITADIVASIISIDVAVGDEVTTGQTVLVMESMKMEIPMTAPAPGVVTRIGVAIGDIVQEGDMLVELTRRGSDAVGP